MNLLKICLSCNRKYHCCINPPLLGYAAVSIGEAEKIKKKTKLDYCDFLTFRKLAKNIIESSKKDFIGSEARLRSDMMINGRILRLKVRRNNECVFFDKEKGCAIYSIRPKICRMYPFWFKEENNKFEILIHSGCEYCKLIDEKKVHKKLTKKQVSQLVKTAEGIKKEAKYYRKNIQDFVKKNRIKG